MTERRARPAGIVEATDSGRGLAAAPRAKSVRRPKRRRSHARITLLIVLIIIAVVGGAGFELYHDLHAARSSDPAVISFLVRHGDTPGSVANRLERDGLIGDAFLIGGQDLFKIDARLNGLSSRLVPGTFKLRRDMSIDQIVAVLAKSNPQEITFTVDPGWRSEQIAELLRALGFNGRAFLHAVRHPPDHLGYRVGREPGHTLEGLLFPDTYTVDPSFTGRQFVTMMVHQFAREFGPSMRRAARREHRSIYQIVKMASIVQREDFLPSQMRLIAGTYYHRLALPAGADGGVGKRLQSDPTVSYAIGRRHGHWWPVISAADAHTVRSRFNTYRHDGLPPAPIANPDRAALLAALHPARTRALYFASCPGDVVLHFQRTFAGQTAFLDGCAATVR